MKTLQADWNATFSREDGLFLRDPASSLCVQVLPSGSLQINDGEPVPLESVAQSLGLREEEGHCIFIVVRLELVTQAQRILLDTSWQIAYSGQGAIPASVEGWDMAEDLAAWAGCRVDNQRFDLERLRSDPYASQWWADFRVR